MHCRPAAPPLFFPSSRARADEHLLGSISALAIVALVAVPCVVESASACDAGCMPRGWRSFTIRRSPVSRRCRPTSQS